MKRSINTWFMTMAVALLLPGASLFGQGIGGAVGGAVDGAVGGAGGAVGGAGRAASGANVRAAPGPVGGRAGAAAGARGSVRSQPAPLNVPQVAPPRVQSDARVRSGAEATIDPRLPARIDAVPRAVVPGASGAVTGRANAGANVGTVPLRLSGDAASRLGIDGNLGMAVDARDRVRISRLDTGSFASTAGLRLGDEILAVNRTWVRTSVDLRNQLNTAIATDGRAWVYVRRDGVPQWVNIGGRVGAAGRVGVDALSRSRLGVDTNVPGSLVTISNIHANSAALAAGLRTGDQVLSVNGVAVRSHADLASQIQAAARADGIVNLDIRRNGVARTVRADLDTGASVTGRAGAGGDVRR